MKGQSVVRVILVVTLVIGLTAFAVSIMAQTAPAPRTGIKPPTFTAPKRAATAPKPPSAAAATYSVVNVSGQALRPKYSPVQYDYYGLGGGAIYATGTVVNEPFSTQVYLPQGATIYALRMYFYRYDISYTCTGLLNVYDSYGAVVNSYPILTGGWTGYNWGDDTPLTHIVDNSNYTYMMEWVPGQASSNMALTSFRIYLQNPPTINKAVVIPLN